MVRTMFYSIWRRDDEWWGYWRRNDRGCHGKKVDGQESERYSEKGPSSLLDVGGAGGEIVADAEDDDVEGL